MKRCILSFPEYEKWSSKITRAIGKSRKNKESWSKEFKRRDIRRFTISGIHYLRTGIIGKSRVWGIAALWDDETGDDLKSLLSL
jgi:hypothetical protein